MNPNLLAQDRDEETEGCWQVKKLHLYYIFCLKKCTVNM